MHGARRVIVFCLLTAVLPTILLIIPLYLRHSVFSDVTYAVAESDILEITDGISTVFCQGHSLSMNSSFHAYQLIGKPMVGDVKKHIKLKKTMSLLDDTLEYWGFYLLEGATVTLSACSRYSGARVLIVQGERNLRTCGLLEHPKTKLFPKPTAAREKPLIEATTDKDEYIPVAKETSTRKDRAVDNQDFEDNFNDASEENLRKFQLIANFAESYLKKLHPDTDLNEEKLTVEEKIVGHKLRHARSRAKRTKHNEEVQRRRRSPDIKIPHNLDRKVSHGGTKTNFTIDSDESSVSSFENSLLECYNGDIMISESITMSNLCNNETNKETMQETTTHTIKAKGYYYYIFYSDNDFFINDIHAFFDIHKPTYEFSNSSDQCINQTECHFNIKFGNEEPVVVEVPTRDGIEKEEDDVTFLVSRCEPRMTIYIIFPVLVLFLILGCAFL